MEQRAATHKNAANARTGIAFIRGIGLYGKKNYTKAQIFKTLKKVETDNILFTGMYGNDNVIFKILNIEECVNDETLEQCQTTNELLYATVGKLIEKTLRREFGGRFYVTTRAFGTVDGIVKKFRAQKDTRVLH